MSWFSSLFDDHADETRQLAADTERKSREAEQKRQSDIRAGQAGIDSAFSQFNPAYYDTFKSAYTGNYIPQINDQYGIAKDKLLATLAGKGTKESTVGANQMGVLTKTRDTAQADVGNQATDAANNLRKQVEDTKTKLYTLNTSAADPQGMSAQAISNATAIAKPEALSPLGQVFASTLQGFGAYNKADATSMRPSLPWNQNAGYFAPTSGGGSSLIR